MKPVFDDNGLAIEAGNIRCFYYCPVTGEYTGWSDEYINVGVSMPGNSTGINPGNVAAGLVSVFSGGKWLRHEDHRGTAIYSTEDGHKETVTTIGAIPDGFVTAAPTTSWDVWNGSEWATDADAQHRAAIEVAELQRQSLIDAAMSSISLIQLKLQAGRKLTPSETTKLNTTLDYIDVVTATDASTAPDVNWPTHPEV